MTDFENKDHSMENARYKVLLIEDNQIEQRMFQRFVESNAIPYDCVIAGSVSEARRILGGERFDIVISDHDLGDGTAFDVLELAKDTPIIVVTGAGDEETAVKAWKAGAYDYLIKDVDQSYLKAIPITVENAIHHKMVEKKLQLLSGAVMSTEDSVYITDMKGVIIFVNKAFCKTYGYTEEEILGQNSGLLWIQKNQGEKTRSVFQTRSFSSGWEVGFYHRRKDESIFPVSLSRSTIKDAQRHDVAIVSVARDISERILIEDELRTTSLKFKKRNQLHNCFSVLVAEILQKLLADGNIDRAATVIQDYLDLSKISAEKLELRRSHFNFAVLAGQVVEALASRAAGKNIALQSFKPDIELMVNADYDRMAQVLNNLIHRAIICSPANGGVEVHMKDGEHELLVEIYDSGPPHGPDQIHTMVNNPAWLREQFQAGREDMALGLRIAKELVEMHGGRIWTEYAKTRRANMICFVMPKIVDRRKLAVAANATEVS
jgi:PAS domain S-box-containing protein